MDLLIVRHAIAEEREEFARTGKPDSRRPLTPAGIEKMRRGAAGLRCLVDDIDILATSPLERAVQTAHIIAEAYGGPDLTTVDELKPDVPPQHLLDWLETQEDARLITVVGHEPHLSELLAWLTCRTDEPCLRFKKGGAALLRFAADVYAGGAELRWLLTAGQLRRLGA